MNAKRSIRPLSLALVAASLGLGGCGERDEGQTVGQRVDSVIGRTTEAAREAGQGAQEAAQDARTATMGAASRAREAASGSATRADDAKISAQVNEALAADKDLGSGAIDVTTLNGTVTLKGTAPNASAKARAGEIARNVRDVKSVDNQLTLRAG